jgi:hypothetical protein
MFNEPLLGMASVLILSNSMSAHLGIEESILNHFIDKVFR